MGIIIEFRIGILIEKYGRILMGRPSVLSGGVKGMPATRLRNGNNNAHLYPEGKTPQI